MPLFDFMVVAILLLLVGVSYTVWTLYRWRTGVGITVAVVLWFALLAWPLLSSVEGGPCPPGLDPLTSGCTTTFKPPMAVR